jgi:hypothetical protein
MALLKTGVSRHPHPSALCALLVLLPYLLATVGIFILFPPELRQNQGGVKPQKWQSSEARGRVPAGAGGRAKDVSSFRFPDKASAAARLGGECPKGAQKGEGGVR